MCFQEERESIKEEVLEELFSDMFSKMCLRLPQAAIAIFLELYLFMALNGELPYFRVIMDERLWRVEEIEVDIVG